MKYLVVILMLAGCGAERTQPTTTTTTVPESHIYTTTTTTTVPVTTTTIRVVVPLACYVNATKVVCDDNGEMVWLDLEAMFTAYDPRLTIVAPRVENKPMSIICISVDIIENVHRTRHTKTKCGTTVVNREIK